MATAHLHAAFATRPYWLDGLASFPTDFAGLPERSDVVVIGAGPGGLSAALTLAGAGASVCVIEAGKIGDGALARSAGSLSHVPRARFSDLVSRYGAETANGIFREARVAREFVEGLIARHALPCPLRRTARFIGAHSARALERQKQSLAALRQAWGDVQLLSREEQGRAIGSDAFFGGVLLPETLTLDPARLLFGLAGAATGAGARLIERTRATGISRNGAGFLVRTDGGYVRAAHVVLAAGAETGSVRPDLGRRIVPMPAFGLVTEPLPSDKIAEVLPIGGPFNDTYNIIHYMAPTPDGRRLLMTGRAGHSDGTMNRKASLIFDYFARRFPALSGVRVTHGWTGRFSISGDWVPHAGISDGVHYLMGCCGTGIPMSTYLGHKAAQHILGSGTPTAFSRPAPPLPPHLNSTLLPFGVRLLGLRDRLFR